MFNLKYIAITLATLLAIALALPIVQPRAPLSHTTRTVTLSLSTKPSFKGPYDEFLLKLGDCRTFSSESAVYCRAKVLIRFLGNMSSFIRSDGETYAKNRGTMKIDDSDIELLCRYHE